MPWMDLREGFRYFDDGFCHQRERYEVVPAMFHARPDADVEAVLLTSYAGIGTAGHT